MNIGWVNCPKYFLWALIINQFISQQKVYVISYQLSVCLWLRRYKTSSVFAVTHILSHFFLYYVCNFLPCPIFVPRRDDFNLPIVHFPLLCSIPAAPAWWVQSSQLIRCSRVSGAYHNFLTANKEATESKGSSSFTVVAITWLTITGYLPQMTIICSVCPNHNSILSSFMWSKPCCSFMDIFII
jgi:hypothetical protein